MQERKAAVLVVEDRPDQARLIAGLLRASGLETEIAASGEEAIAAMDRRTPEVVVTDLILPGWSGLDVVEQVRQRHPLVPVILMTAYGSAEIATRALKQGAASYVPKRCLNEELVPTVRDLLAVAATRREQARVLASMEGSEYRFVLSNDATLIPGLVAFVHEWIDQHGVELDEGQQLQVGVALHEALVNAMHHGNLEIGSKVREASGDEYRRLVAERAAQSPYRERRVHVTLTLSPRELACVIRDDGPGFAPEGIPDPTAPENLERVSGRGLYLIWTFMDRVSHNAQGNEITLVKKLVPR